MNNGDLTIAIITAVIGIVGAAWAATRYFNSEIRRIQDRGDDRLEASSQEQSKLRHEASNRIHVEIGRQELNFEQLRREAVRREELGAMEVRFGERIRTIETKLDRALETLPAIVERLDALRQLSKQTVERNSRVDQTRDGLT